MVSPQMDGPPTSSYTSDTGGYLVCARSLSAMLYVPTSPEKEEAEGGFFRKLPLFFRWLRARAPFPVFGSHRCCMLLRSIERRGRRDFFSLHDIFLLAHKRYGVYYGCSSILRLTRIWANRSDTVFVSTIYGKGIFLPAALVPTAEEEEVKAIEERKKTHSHCIQSLAASPTEKGDRPTLSPT